MYQFNVNNEHGVNMQTAVTRGPHFLKDNMVLFV